jgi:sulfur carrier protein
MIARQPADRLLAWSTLVTIRLNGDPFDLAGALTVLQLLEHLQIDPRRVAVEHNLVIVKRDRYGATTVREGDQIEIVNFVGGG